MIKAVIPIIILLLAQGCVYDTYQASSDIHKIQEQFPSEFSFYMQDPELYQSDHFSGEYVSVSGSHRIPMPTSFSIEELRQPTGKYTSVQERPAGVVMSVNLLSGIKDINATAMEEYPNIFSNKESALPIRCKVAIDAIESETENMLNTDILSFSLELLFQDKDKKDIKLGNTRFKIAYRKKSLFFITPSVPLPMYPGRKIELSTSSFSGRNSQDGFAAYARVYNYVLSRAIVDGCVKIILEQQGKVSEALANRRNAIQEEQIDRHFALSVGVSKYKYADGGLSSLTYADQDAAVISSLFSAKLNWPKSRIYTLTNEKATKKNILAALNQIMAQIKERDLLTIYWSGHGFTVGEQHFLASYDTNVKDISSAISMAELRRLIEEKQIRNVLFIADTCHAGGMITGTRGLSVSEIYRETLIPTKEKTGGWIFMLASESDRQAVEDKQWGHGAFTYCLVKGLNGEADGFEGTGNKDNIITPAELKAYLNTRVPLETQNTLGSAIHPLIQTTSADIKIWEINIYEK